MKAVDRLRAFFVTIVCTLTSAGMVWADQDTHTFGDYIIHHNAITTDALQPTIAKAYGIPRSNDRAMVNIVVRKKVSGSSYSPVHAKISGSAANLNGQVKNFNLREINEQDAVYYISDFRVSNQEMLSFTFEVTPEGESTPYTVKFRRQFFTK